MNLVRKLHASTLSGTCAASTECSIDNSIFGRVGLHWKILLRVCLLATVCWHTRRRYRQQVPMNAQRIQTKPMRTLSGVSDTGATTAITRRTQVRTREHTHTDTRNSYTHCSLLGLIVHNFWWRCNAKLHAQQSAGDFFCFAL